MKERIIDFLLENANPSIVYRVKKEILNKISHEEEMKLINQILLEKNVKIATDSIMPNGWIGKTFHGSKNLFDNMEVGLRYLAEKGLPPEHKIIKNAIAVLESTPKNDPLYGMHKYLLTPDDDYTHTASGVYLPRSSIAIRVGYEQILADSKELDVKHDIDFSLKCFFNVLTVDDVNDIIYERRDKFCYVDGTLWPCIYNLRMLSFSNGWRNEKHLTLLSDSIKRIYELKPPEKFVYTYYRGQLRGPCMALFNPINESLKNGQVGGMYFDRLELLARCGIVSRVNEFSNEYEILLESINKDLIFNFKVIPKYAFGWSPYFGFALENDWKSKIRKQCDILFRVLLIMHYAECTK